MSTVKRKIGFYCIEFKNKTKGHNRFFKKDIFCDVMNYILSKSDEDKIIKREPSNKAEALELFEIYSRGETELVKIIFKSCKYNHSPNYMSSINGTERESDKSLNEGEKERTHILGRFYKDEFKFILEERKSGMAIGSIVKYLNHFINEYHNTKEDIPYFRVEYGIVPLENFEKNLEKMIRVCGADIYIHKKLLGSEGLDIMERTDSFMRDEIKLSCKVKKGESLIKRNLKKMYNSAISEGEEISRIRIYGRDENNVNVFLDSDIMKKIEYVDTILNEEKGTVDTHAFFSKVEEIFGVDI